MASRCGGRRLRKVEEELEQEDLKDIPQADPLVGIAKPTYGSPHELEGRMRLIAFDKTRNGYPRKAET